MEKKELMAELEGLKSSLETSISEKTKSEIADQLKSVVTAIDEKISAFANGNDSAEAVKAMSAEFNALKAEQAAILKGFDLLQTRVKGNGKTAESKKSFGEVFGETLKNNFDAFQAIKKGSPLRLDMKAVGNMTTANFTGEEPRDYNFDIVKFPAQMVNVADLTGNIAINGGTYTYTVEGAGEGSISAQTEGSAKSQRDYDFTAVDVSTNFIAGFARYSKKMRNNLSYITSAIPDLLRRDYWKAENTAFNTILATDATPSTEIITGSSKSEMLINEIGKLEDANYTVNGIVIRPTDYLDILKTAKQDLESAVTYEGGVLRVAGVQVFKATWLAANKYYVGDWSRVNKVTTEGLSLEFSETEGSNFVNNNITARIEAQVALAVEQPLALVYGDFTAV